MPILFPRESRWLSSARSRGIVLQPTPHPAYGSEFSTDGNRLVRALEGNGAGCRFTPHPVLQAAGPFPVSSTACTIGEQKAKVKSIRVGVVTQFEFRCFMASDLWHHITMRRRSSKGDVAQNALRVVEEAIGAPLAVEPKK